MLMQVGATKIHVNGIGGKGMAPAAALGHLVGYVVTGDDLYSNHRTELLRVAGIPIEIGQNSIGSADTDIVVRTEAISPSVYPLSSRIRMSRLELVDSIFTHLSMKQICVSGSFGKSTAASLLRSTLSILSPSTYIGADVPGTLCGASLGKRDLAIIEACEYRDAYLALHPWMAILLNTFENHEDYFGAGVEGFASSFENYIRRNDRTLEHIILNEDGVHASLITPQVSAEIHKVGFGTTCRWRVSVTAVAPDGSCFSIFDEREGHDLGTFRVPFSGAHLISAAAIAVVASVICGASIPDIRNGLMISELPERRFSVRYESSSVSGVDDNARQPPQVIALASALRQRWPDSRVCLVARPWGRRNARNLSEWALALGNADAVIILPVGDASTTEGGAELPNAAELLQVLLTDRGIRSWTAQSVPEATKITHELISEGLHLVLATVGYDSAQEAFDEIHSIVESQMATEG